MTSRMARARMWRQAAYCLLGGVGAGSVTSLLLLHSINLAFCLMCAIAGLTCFVASLGERL